MAYFYASSLCFPFVVSFARNRAVMLILMPTADGLLSVRRRLGRQPPGRGPQWKHPIWGPVVLGRILAGDHALLRI